MYYNNLRPADVDRLEAEARTLALAALRHLNGLALEMQQAARGARGARERFRFGVYFFREDTAAKTARDAARGREGVIRRRRFARSAAAAPGGAGAGAAGRRRAAREGGIGGTGRSRPAAADRTTAASAAPACSAPSPASAACW